MRFAKGDKFVCAECFDDEGIQQFINANASERTCSFCDRTEDDEIAAEWGEVVDYIDTCLAREYEGPEDGVGRDMRARQGGMRGFLLMDTWDLFGDLGFGNRSDKVFEDLVDEFIDRQWVQADPYGSRPCDYWRYSWEAFSRQVKHEMRFVFFKVKTQDDYGP
ncbi:MAG: HEPN-associated N-terminal domain-containing protein [Chthoniobacter sp.]